MPCKQRWREMQILGGPGWHRIVDRHAPAGRRPWLNVDVPVEPLRPWHSPTFLAAFVLMTVAAAVLTLWAVRRLTAPVRTLAAAAEALGRDVNAPPLPEDGPTEVATAAAAFNTMAARIRRFVQDRTELLTAIGHDLRTPITRLKLRAEFIEDDEQRAQDAGRSGGAGGDGLGHAGVRPRRARRRAGVAARPGGAAAHGAGRGGRCAGRTAAEKLATRVRRI